MKGSNRGAAMCSLGDRRQQSDYTPFGRCPGEMQKRKNKETQEEEEKEEGENKGCVLQKNRSVVSGVLKENSRTEFQRLRSVDRTGELWGL